VHGVSKESLDAVIASADPGPFSADQRRDALARFREMPVYQPVRPSRYWKHDLAKLEVGDIAIEAPSLTASGGIAAIDAFAAIARGGREIPGKNDPFTSLAVAFANAGAGVRIPAGRSSDDPVLLNYAFAPGAGFPYTFVHAGAGSRATVIERIDAPAGAFGCGLVEIVVEDNAELHYVVEQTAQAARLIMDRRATLGVNARLIVGVAELGAELTVSRFRSTTAGAGGHVELSSLFFPSGTQHVDVTTETRHSVGHTTSTTVVRSAASGSGQGRYFGNIAIAEGANGCEATLRDDALLLSKQSHIDSVPALEIATNDVKAYHGATVGAINDEEIFYAQSRGITRKDAERMIALGFFEPAIVRFPGDALRERLRTAVSQKLESV
jgi:Fe-S cluster assembly protein SufD